METQNFEHTFFNTSYLEEFFLDELKNIYNSEIIIEKKLPAFQVLAASPRLKMALEEQLRNISMHIVKLGELMKTLEIEPGNFPCTGMEGLIKEAEKIEEETPAGSSTRDIALIIAIQKIRHYEIATYNSLIFLTTPLRLHLARTLLEEIVGERYTEDRLLSDIAETGLNYHASNEF